MDNFYMCYVEGTRGPEAQHESMTAAEHEAKRLAALSANRHRPVFVLEPILKFEVEEPEPPLRITHLRQGFSHLTHYH